MMNVVPCSDRVKNACVVTLFSLTRCIKASVFSISFHMNCMVKVEDVDVI